MLSQGRRKWAHADSSDGEPARIGCRSAQAPSYQDRYKKWVCAGDGDSNSDSPFVFRSSGVVSSSSARHGAHAGIVQSRPCISDTSSDDGDVWQRAQHKLQKRRWQHTSDSSESEPRNQRHERPEPRRAVVDLTIGAMQLRGGSTIQRTLTTYEEWGVVA